MLATHGPITGEEAAGIAWMEGWGRQGASSRSCPPPAAAAGVGTRVPAPLSPAAFLL